MMLAGAAFAAREPEVDKALKEKYPDATTEIVSTRDVNGVRVRGVKITTKTGDAMADVTENGDFLSYGLPRGEKKLNSTLQSQLAGLLKATPDKADMYRTVLYLVQLDNGKQKYQLTYDAVGRLVDITNPAQLKAIAKDASAEKADKNTTKKIAALMNDWTERDGKRGKIGEVFNSTQADGFYYVTFTTAAGENAAATVAEDGRIWDWREAIPAGELPKPARQAAETMFDAGAIKNVYRYEYEYFELPQTAPNGQVLNLHLRPNGDVVSVTPKETATAEKEDAAPVKKKKK